MELCISWKWGTLTYLWQVDNKAITKNPIVGGILPLSIYTIIHWLDVFVFGFQCWLADLQTVACAFFGCHTRGGVCVLGCAGFGGTTVEAIPPSYSFSTSTGSQNVSGSELVNKYRQLSIGVFRDKSLSTYYIKIWFYGLISWVQCPVHIFHRGNMLNYTYPIWYSVVYRKNYLMYHGVSGKITCGERGMT